MDDICLLTSVWQRRQQRKIPTSISSTFYDDSSIVVTNIRDACESLKETDKFDCLTAQRTNAKKTVAMATEGYFGEALEQAKVGGGAITVWRSGKLTGALIVATGEADPALADKRLMRTFAPSFG